MTKKIERDVFERLLLAKALLSGVQLTPAAKPDRLTAARHILIAHDAAELVLSTVAQHLKCQTEDRSSLVDYAGAIKKKTRRDIPHRQFFSNLNHQRIGVKHRGLMPDVDQWGAVGEVAYRNISAVCERYLRIQLNDVDESLLIQDEGTRSLLAEAKDAYQKGKYQAALEVLGYALWMIFKDSDSPSLRNLLVGEARAEDAIRLSAFGVNANEFLAMQEFLPRVREDQDKKVKFECKQDSYGHPGNWTAETAEFCLKTFVHVAVRIQSAEWIPSPIRFLFVYRHKVTALEDNVQIVQVRVTSGNALGAFLPSSDPSHERVIVRTLSKGQSVIGLVSKNDEPSSLLRFSLGASAEPRPPTIYFHSFGPDKISGEIERDKVRVTCVSQEDEFVKKYYPDLPEIGWLK